MHRQRNLLAKGLDERAGGEGTAQAGHVFYREDVRTHFFQLLREADVVFQRILRALGIENVAGVADRSLANAARVFSHRFHRSAHVRKVVQRVENPEDIHAALGGVFDETSHDIRRVVRVADGIRAAQEHLEADVRNPLAKLAEAVPRVLVEKTHRGVEGRPAPHFEAEKPGRTARHGVGHGEHVIAAHARGEEGLVRVAEGRVGKKQALLLARPLGEFLGSKLEQKLARSRRRGLLAVVARPPSGLERGGNAVTLGLRVAVHNHIGEEREQARGAVAAGLEFE